MQRRAERFITDQHELRVFISDKARVAAMISFIYTVKFEHFFIWLEINFQARTY